MGCVNSQQDLRDDHCPNKHAAGDVMAQSEYGCGAKVRIGLCLVRCVLMPEATFLHGDCLEVLPTLPKGSVDMVFCDLPYGYTLSDWDQKLCLESLWVGLKHVAASRCSFVFTATQPFATEIIISQKSWFKHELVWDKNASSAKGVAKYRPLPFHEGVYVFGQNIYYEPCMTKLAKPRLDRGRKGDFNSVFASSRKGTHDKMVTERFPTSIIRVSRHSPEKGLHPTQKPQNLLRYLFKMYCRQNGTVLDPTAGSGSTAVAALLENRNSISIEKDPVIFANAKERVMAVQRSLTPRRAEG